MHSIGFFVGLFTIMNKQAIIKKRMSFYSYPHFGLIF